ncbi:MAG: thiamine-phosphate kinase [Nitrospirae bacterium]|nr:thiamine-phosphate kinase [Candidatus Manganitrophaceae bacterium]
MIKIGEFDFIAQIQRQFASKHEFVSLGIGDDAAAFIPSRGCLSLLTTDTLIEDIHFTRTYSSFEQVGIKAVAVNLSDIAAMGGQPRAFLISLGVPNNMECSDLNQLYKGILKASRPSNLALIGGNTTRTNGPFFISITLHGEVSKKQMITRCTATLGDAIYVTGTLGDAAAGLDCLKQGRATKGYRHLLQRQRCPEARTTEGMLIAKTGIASAMIDISDSLSADLNHMMQQSRVGAELTRTQIPLSLALKRYAKQHKMDALDFALYGGEDYELLFCVPPSKEKKLTQLIKNDFIQATRIGKICSKREGIFMLGADKKKQALRAKGYDHFLEKS